MYINLLYNISDIFIYIRYLIGSIRYLIYRINSKTACHTFMPNRLFYLSSLERSVLYKECLVNFYYYRLLYTFPYTMQTVWTLIRHRVLRRLICVYTVYQCPCYGMPGLNGLISKPFLCYLTYSKRATKQIRPCFHPKRYSKQVLTSSLLASFGLSQCLGWMSGVLPLETFINRNERLSSAQNLVWFMFILLLVLND